MARANLSGKEVAPISCSCAFGFALGCQAVFCLAPSRSWPDRIKLCSRPAVIRKRMTTSELSPGGHRFISTSLFFRDLYINTPRHVDVSVIHTLTDIFFRENCVKLSRERNFIFATLLVWKWLKQCWLREGVEGVELIFCLRTYIKELKECYVTKIVCLICY